MSIRTLLALSACAGLAACASPASLPTVEYLCNNQTALRVTYVDDDALVLMPNGYAVTLPRQVTASGFHYADERHDLRGKGNEVTFALGGGAPLVCRSPGS